MQESSSLRSENSWICIGILLHSQIEELEGGLAQAASALVKNWLTSTTCAGWTLILGSIIIIYCEIFFILKQLLYKKLLFFEAAMVKGLYGQNLCQILLPSLLPFRS